MPRLSAASSDPWSIAIAPPPNESLEQRANRLKGEADARRISDEIDEQLRADAVVLKNRNAVKLLLLGQSESGKSTTLKNFQRTYARKAWEQERASWRIVVQLNLVRSINLILEVLASKLAHKGHNDTSVHLTDTHQLLKLRLTPLKHVELELRQRLGATSLEEPFPLGPSSNFTSSLPSKPSLGLPSRRSHELFVRDHSLWKSLSLRHRPSSVLSRSSDQDEVVKIIAGCHDDMKALWSDPVSRQFVQNGDVKLQESAPFFLDDIDRIAARNYTPTDDDIIRARLRTVGIQEYKLDLDDKGPDWYIYDVGGTHSQRAAWLPYFEDCDAIIFLAPVSCFDERLGEDPRINRLEDSFLLWKSICSSPLLVQVTLIVFLNKMDILTKKLRAGKKVNFHLPSYGNRPNEAEAVARYLREQFKDVLRQKSRGNRPFYGYPTVAVDKEATANTILTVREDILRKTLKKIEII